MRFDIILDRVLRESEKLDFKSEEELEDWLEQSGRNFYYDLETVPKSLYDNWHLPDGEWYYLCKLVVRKDVVGNGYATQAIHQAKATVPPNAGILLKARPFITRPGIDINRLKNLYRKCGFRDYGPPALGFMVWVGPEFKRPNR